jgi:hypothetical protein
MVELVGVHFGALDICPMFASPLRASSRDFSIACVQQNNCEFCKDAELPPLTELI